MDNRNANNLTKRELEILKLVAMGYTKNQIAELVCVTIHTVKAHLESIYFKTGAHNKIQAIVTALKKGLLELGEL